LAVLSLAVAAFSMAHVGDARAASGVGKTISLSGTGSPQASNPAGDEVNDEEFANEPDDANGPAAYPGTISSRSLSQGTGAGASVGSSKKAKSNPQFNTGFEGLNHFQQRYSNRGNQFSIEPPD